jgi:4,5-dihydroxyphthalate decarboxylase
MRLPAGLRDTEHTMDSKTDQLTLHTLLGNYPNVAALKDGRIESPLVRLDFADVKVPSTAFKPLVREAKYDLGELAIITYLQAKAAGKPYVLLPIPVMGRGQHHTLVYNSERAQVTPAGLSGRRVGVRAYTVTTGAWVRGILAEDYGVATHSVHWVTFEDPHVAEYQDPDFVQRAPVGKQINQMLLDGEIDAAVLGEKPSDPRLKTVIPDAEAEAEKWAARHGGMPINHLMVIRTSIAQSRPDVVREIYRMFVESRQAEKSPIAGSKLDSLRFGVEPMRRTLEVIIDYALEQKLIPRRYSVDELFDDTTVALGL